MSNFEKVLVHGKLAITGNPEFEKKELFGLQADEKIFEIGVRNSKGNITSAHRVDTFTMPLTYCGIIRFPDDPDPVIKGNDYAAFYVPPEGVLYKKKRSPVGVYLLYVVMWEYQELIRQDFRNLVPYIFKAEFKKAA